MRSVRGGVGVLVLAGCARSAQPMFTPDAQFDVATDAGVDAADARPSLDAAVDVPVDVMVFDIQPVDRPRDVAPDEDEPVDVVADVARDVAPDVPMRRVDHCYLAEPSILEVAPGATAASVAAHVFVAGVTSGMGAGGCVTVEIGSGPGGTDPLTSAAWRWAAGVYERDVDGAGAAGARDYDRVQGAAPTPEMPGEYAYAARARVAGGPWTACDLVSTTPHTYAPAFAGRLTVALATAPRVEFCNLQFPRVMTAASAMTAPMPAFGRVFAAGVTDRGCTDRPTASALTAQLGVGPAGSFPSDANWVWADGAIEGHRDSVNPVGEGDCHNLEYRATLRAPAACVPHAYAWRFRRDAGPWSYCRWAPPAMDAPTTPVWSVYDPSLAGALTVTGCP